MKKTTILICLFLLGFIKSQAQSVSTYSFQQSTETYTPVSGTNSLAAGDDGAQNLIPLEFGFNYGGTIYNSFSISTNGWIRLGTNIGNQSWVNGLSNTSAQSPLIAPFWDDHNRNTGSIQYAVSGIAPGRILEIGWDNINLGNGGGTSATAFGSFKMRLYEANGQIDFVYGPTMNLAGNLSASIGLNDATSFLSVSPEVVSSASSSTANNTINTTQYVTGQKFTFTPQSQCAGTPDPGNTISSASSVCNNASFFLSVQNSISGFGISYQWEYAADGVNFNPIPNANLSVYNATQSVATTYRCQVSCGVNSAFSTPVTVAMNPLSACYCNPSYTNGKTDGDLISNVVIDGTTLANNTGTAPVNPYYTYFTGAPNYTAILQGGQSYQMSVTVGTYQNQNDAVWIDYNDDTVFTLDERVGYSQQIDANGTGLFTITLACDAPAGLHRMRVRDVWATDATTIDPCANYGYGETEDYDITIIAATGCMLPFNLSTGVINPTSAELAWEVGCGQTAWDIHVTVTGGGLPTGDPSDLNVHNPATIENLQPNTTYDFYVRGNCGANGESDWAGPFSFTTLAPGPANDECSGAQELIAGGTFEEHAVIGTNISATKSTNAPNPTCAVFGFGGDVWYSVVVPEDGNITLEVQADPGSPFIDSGLTAFSGTCGDLTTIACSDDEGIEAFSRLNLTGLTPGQTIYARVWEYANDTFGTFQFSAWNPALQTNTFDALQFKVYPNPVKDVLAISAKETITAIEVYNLLGQKVKVQLVNANQDKVDMTELPKGTYLVKVMADNDSRTIKIIKE